MTAITDNFDDPRGRFTDWSSILETEPVDAFLTNNEHVDLRVFDSVGEWEDRPVSELDELEMGDIEATLEVSKGAVTIAFPAAAEFTNTTHGLDTTSIVKLATTGSLVPGMDEDRSYYVTSTPTGNTFSLSATPSGTASGKDIGVSFAGSTDYYLGDVVYEVGDPTKLHRVVKAGYDNLPANSGGTTPYWYSTTVGDQTIVGDVTFEYVGLTTDVSGTHSMTAFIDDSIYDEQIELERKSARPGEGWTTSLTSGEGGYGSDAGLKTVTVGNLALYDNWRGLSALTDGVAIDLDIVSAIQVDSSIDGSDPLDLSDQDDLIIIFPDYNTFDDANCTVQLSSHESGGFDVNTGNSDSTELSASVAFSSNTSALPELRLALSGFTAAGFDIAAVTGIKIHLDKAVAPAADLAFTIMGIRAVATAWEYRAIDFDTVAGGLTSSPTLDGLDPPGSDDFIPIVRGTGIASDPRPIDASLTFDFNTGGRTNVATGGVWNKIEGIFRERQTSGTESKHLIARLKWNDGATWFETEAYDWDDPTVTLSGQLTHDLSTTLQIATDSDQDAGRYRFKVDLIGTEFLMSLFKLNSQGEVTALVTSNAVSMKSTEYTVAEGRVGLYLEFPDRDAVLYQMTSAGTAYATMLTKAFPSRTPVKGVQIHAEYSADANLFRNWNDIRPAEFFIDRSKTTSGYGSRRTESGLISNQFFVIEDWAQTYLEMDVWVGSGITESNKPVVQFTGGDASLAPNLPALQPNRWNHIKVELEQFRESPTGEFYQLEIAPLLKDGKLGYFWVDSVKVGKRSIRWEARAESSNEWRELRGVTNEEWGALHFGNSERGSNLQIRASAIEQDAWVGSYKAMPAYATLGALV